MRIVCATTNAGKLREFLPSLPATFDLAPLADLNRIEPPEETGKTFEENAILKAIYYSRGTTELLFAEDSGLEVDALDKAPGVYSARFSGPDATDEANNALLLERLRGVENRAARYVA
ncbi:MAG: non-canonical purine NTP pyrophosphatase, partial [Bryobacteraceae bacterium]